MLQEKIYYAEQIQSILNLEFDQVDSAPWFRLYKQKADGSLWRLDEWDKHQQQYLVHIKNQESWSTYDATELQIDLLKRSRGQTDKICSWSSCTNNALQGLVFCERHAFLEMGVRK